MALFINGKRTRLRDAMGVSKLHNASKRDQSGIKTMQPGSSAPRKATEQNQSTPCFSGFFLFFQRGMMSELHERFVAYWQFGLSLEL